MDINQLHQLAPDQLLKHRDGKEGRYKSVVYQDAGASRRVQIQAALGRQSGGKGASPFVLWNIEDVEVAK